jgi:hypothetical protein
VGGRIQYMPVNGAKPALFAIVLLTQKVGRRSADTFTASRLGSAGCTGF